MAAIAQADRPDDWALEVKSNGKADVDRRLGAALPAAHEVPERERLTGPLKDLDRGGWKSADPQLLFDLTAE